MCVDIIMSLSQTYHDKNHAVGVSSCILILFVFDVSVYVVVCLRGGVSVVFCSDHKEWQQTVVVVAVTFPDDDTAPLTCFQ